MRIEGAEERITRLENQVALWQAECERAEARAQGARKRVEELEAEYRRVAERGAAAEQRVGQLAQLLAAALQLHAAPLPADVLTVIKEIVANLVGCEEMGVFGRRADGSLTLLDGIGADLVAQGAIHLPALERTLRTGETMVQNGVPVACVPLRAGGRPLGVIALFRLLPQKPALDAVDRELFELLATHAALALHHAELRASA